MSSAWRISSRHGQGCDIVRLAKRRLITGDAREVYKENIMVDGNTATNSVSYVGGMLECSSNQKKRSSWYPFLSWLRLRHLFPEVLPISGWAESYVNGNQYHGLLLPRLFMGILWLC